MGERNKLLIELHAEYDELLNLENSVCYLYEHGADSSVIYTETLENGDVIDHTKEMVMKEKLEEIRKIAIAIVIRAYTDNDSVFASRYIFDKAISYSDGAKNVLNRLSDIIEAYFKGDTERFNIRL